MSSRNLAVNPELSVESADFDLTVWVWRPFTGDRSGRTKQWSRSVSRANGKAGSSRPNMAIAFRDRIGRLFKPGRHLQASSSSGNLGSPQKRGDRRLRVLRETRPSPLPLLVSTPFLVRQRPDFHPLGIVQGAQRPQINQRLLQRRRLTTTPPRAKIRLILHPELSLLFFVSKRHGP